LTLVGRDELTIVRPFSLGIDHRLRTAAQKFRAIRIERIGKSVEPLDQIIIKLDQNFSSSHDHMLSHMVNPSDLETPGTKRHDPATFAAGFAVLPNG